MTIDKAIIVETTDADPMVDRIVRRGTSGTLTIVDVAHASQIVDVATALVHEGARLIELCGGISVTSRAAVLEAVGDRAMVSSVTFSIESIVRAAAYNGAFMAGGPTREAFIIIDDSAEPAIERMTRSYPALERTLVFVRDAESAAAVAAELAETGIGLIELYGGFSTGAAADVIDAVDGRAPVGVGSFAYDAAAEPVAG